MVSPWDARRRGGYIGPKPAGVVVRALDPVVDAGRARVLTEGLSGQGKSDGPKEGASLVGQG